MTSIIMINCLQLIIVHNFAQLISNGIHIMLYNVHVHVVSMYMYMSYQCTCTCRINVHVHVVSMYMYMSYQCACTLFIVSFLILLSCFLPLALLHGFRKGKNHYCICMNMCSILIHVQSCDLCY